MNLNIEFDSKLFALADPKGVLLGPEALGKSGNIGRKSSHVLWSFGMGLENSYKLLDEMPLRNNSARLWQVMFNMPWDKPCQVMADIRPSKLLIELGK